ncbi:helix-turn-helix transcriptional regulator [Streptomyces caatingaensis]|uniref:HTH luxR-type domain-containing protein n=1 Tax=Streptomyces caatingaensis TaxID=1678637 RepID=A0A0K9XGE4_9ACTN|nr:LuxR family transcriptional regulator [Streptomyces caatingaensis]KNB52151.1 hypothetical protein AC230_11330 [Streptomyces caatingaensis]
MGAEAAAGGFLAAVRDAELAETVRRLRAGTGVLLVGDVGSGKSTLLRAALERLRRDGARVLRLEDLPAEPGERAVVAADDIHLAGPAALAALRRPVRDGHAVVLAAAPAGASLPPDVRRLVLHDALRPLEIGPFDRTGVARVLAARYGGPVPVGTADRFWELSRGNALILRHLMDCAPDGGAGPPYAWVPPDRHGPGDAPDGRLTELARLLLGDLTDDERELVRMLALAGPLGAGLPVVDELGPAAEALAERGVVTVERSGARLSLRLTRPLCEAVIRASMPELTARRLRLRLADAIAATGARRRGDRARATALRMDAGRSPGSAEVRDAALDALRDHDFGLAERLCATVYSFEMAPAPDIALLLGRALAGQRRYQEAEALFAGAWRGGADAACAAALLRARFLNLALGLHRPADAAALAAEAEYRAPSGGRPDSMELRLLTGLFTDRLAAAVPDGRRSAAPAALVRHVLGDGEGALALLRACPSGLCPWDEDGRLDHAVITARVALHTEGAPAAAAVLERLRAEDGGPRHRLHTALLGAELHRWAGRTAEAALLLREAAARRGPADWLTTDSWRLAQLAAVLAESGETDEALAVLDEAQAAEDAALPVPWIADAVALECASVLARAGDRAAAERRALAVAERAGAAGRIRQRIAALHLAARVGAAGRAAAALPAPGRDPSGTAAVRARHVRALADGDGDALDAVSADFAALGALPWAAEAAARAAAVHRAAGRQARCRESADTARRLLPPGGAVLPDWAGGERDEDVPRPRARLTSREREVVSLAVARLSNQEIAGRLVLSVRTVENHLYRAYGKLGVTTRTELARRLGR